MSDRITGKLPIQPPAPVGDRTDSVSHHIDIEALKIAGANFNSLFQSAIRNQVETEKVAEEKRIAAEQELKVKRAETVPLMAAALIVHPAKPVPKSENEDDHKHDEEPETPDKLRAAVSAYQKNINPNR